MILSKSQGLNRNERQMIAEEKRQLQDNIKMKKEEMMKKFEKLLRKGKFDRNEIMKEITILKGEKVHANSQQFNTEYQMSRSVLSDDDEQIDYVKTEHKTNDNLPTETDYRGVSTYATFDG
jgi:hypothetical protein